MYYFPITVSIADQTPLVAKNPSAFPLEITWFPTDQPEAEGRKRGNKFRRSIRQNYQVSLNYSSKPRERKRGGVKKAVKGPFQSSKNGLWKCRWDLRPRLPSNMSDILNHCIVILHMTFLFVCVTILKEKKKHSTDEIFCHPIQARLWSKEQTL